MTEKHQHWMNNNLCFNCDHSDHQTRDCSYWFYFYRVTLWLDKDSVKAQSLQEQEQDQKQSQFHARSQSTHAFKNNNNEIVSHADNSESKSEHFKKHQKNWTDFLSNMIWDESLLLFLHTESTLFRLRKSLIHELKSHCHVKSLAAVIYLSDLTLIQWLI